MKCSRSATRDGKPDRSKSVSRHRRRTKCDAANARRCLSLFRSLDPMQPRLHLLPSVPERSRKINPHGEGWVWFLPNPGFIHHLPQTNTPRQGRQRKLLRSNRRLFSVIPAGPAVLVPSETTSLFALGWRKGVGRRSQVEGCGHGRTQQCAPLGDRQVQTGQRLDAR